MVDIDLTTCTLQVERRTLRVVDSKASTILEHTAPAIGEQYALHRALAFLSVQSRIAAAVTGLAPTHHDDSKQHVVLTVTLLPSFFNFENVDNAVFNHTAVLLSYWEDTFCIDAVDGDKGTVLTTAAAASRALYASHPADDLPPDIALATDVDAAWEAEAFTTDPRPKSCETWRSRSFSPRTGDGRRRSPPASPARCTTTSAGPWRGCCGGKLREEWWGRDNEWWSQTLAA